MGRFHSSKSVFCILVATVNFFIMYFSNANGNFYFFCVASSNFTRWHVRWHLNVSCFIRCVGKSWLWISHKNSFLKLIFILLQFKIQFDDSLTSTFEYPSESSLLIDETFGDDDDEVDASFYGRSGSSKLLTSVPLGEHQHWPRSWWIFMFYFSF